MASRSTWMRHTIYKIALSGILIASAVHLPCVAAPVLSSSGVVKTAAEQPFTKVQCELTGWDWTGGGIRDALWPGILAVGGYYNSLSYGYSGAPPYYGERRPHYYPYGCVYGYPGYDVPARYARRRHRHATTAYVH